MADFKIADGYIEVRAEKARAERDLAGIGKSGAGGAAKSGVTLGRALVGGFLAIGAGNLIKTRIMGAVNSSSDLNETISKSGAIFGDQSARMLEWSANADRSLGVSQSQALAAAAGFGDLFTQLGFTSDAAAGMSQNTLQAAADLGSFSNLETADVAERITAAFRGEYDSLQAVIPNINAARVESEALATTGKRTAAELTAQEKATAVLAIVSKDGSRAMGDFAKTQDSFANSSKTNSAMVGDLSAKWGTGLLPVFAAASVAIRDNLLPAVDRLTDAALPRLSAGVLSVMAFFGNWRANLAELASWLASTPIGAALVASFPALISLGQQVSDIFTGSLWPAAQNVATSLGQAATDTGISTWGLFVNVLTILLPVIQVLATGLLQLSNFMRDNQGLVNALVIAFTAYKVVSLGIAAVTAVKTAAIWAEIAAKRASTTAWIANTAAQIASKAQTVAIVALYAGSFIASLARSTAALMANTAAWVVSKLQMTGQLVMMGLVATGMGIQAAAMGVATVATWAFNAAMAVLTSPITLVVLGIAALIAIIVLLATNWDTVVAWITARWTEFTAWITTALTALGEWWNGVWQGISDFVRGIVAAIVLFAITYFQNLLATWQGIGAAIAAWWNGLWGGISSFVTGLVSGFVSAVIGFFSGLVSAWQGIGAGLAAGFSTVWNGIRSTVEGVVNGIRSGWEGMLSFFGGIPGAIGDKLSGVASAITGAFRGPLNKVIGLWNNSIGKLSIKIPDWVPGIGGTNWSAPKIPGLYKGGTITGSGAVMVGEQGPEILNLDRGASVIPLKKAGGGGGGGQTITFGDITVMIDPTKIKSLEDLLDLIANLSQTARTGKGR
jgi:phage-related protein